MRCKSWKKVHILERGVKLQVSGENIWTKSFRTTFSKMESTSAVRPHVLIVPFPSQGHVRPLMQLAQQLNCMHGFKVTFANTSHIHKRVGLHNAMRVTDDFQFVDLQEGFPDNFYIGLATLRDLFVACFSLGPILKKLIENLLESSPITCIISDLQFLEVHKMALQFGLPSVGFSTHCALALSTEYYSSRVVEAGLLPLPKQDEATALAKMVTCIPGMAPIRVGDLHSALLVDDLSNPSFQFFGVEQSKHFCNREWILVNTFHEFEASVIEALQKDVGEKLIAIGPLVIEPTNPAGPSNVKDKKSSFSTFWPEEMECMDWLDKQPAMSVIYVSFGSQIHMTASTFGELVLGLEVSQVPFIVVVRANFVEAGTTIDEAQCLPKGFKERTKDRALIVPWAPQLKVLSHPATAGFVTHCGWNSVMESTCMGVPMLCYPYFSDQNINSRYIESVWKTGWELEKGLDGHVERQEVAQKVKALVAKKSTVRDAALNWEDVARRATESGGSSHNNLSAFVAAMYRKATP